MNTSGLIFCSLIKFCPNSLNLNTYKSRSTINLRWQRNSQCQWHKAFCTYLSTTFSDSLICFSTLELMFHFKGSTLRVVGVFCISMLLCRTKWPHFCLWYARNNSPNLSTVTPSDAECSTRKPQIPSLETTIYNQSKHCVKYGTHKAHTVHNIINYLQELIEPSIWSVQVFTTPMQQHGRHVWQIHFGNLNRVPVAGFRRHFWCDKIIKTKHKQAGLDKLQVFPIGFI